MPYLLLILGLLVGLIALYRFVRRADAGQLKALFITAGFIMFCLALFYLAVTGRLPAALALLAAVSPTALGLWKIKREGSNTSQTSSQGGHRKPAASDPAMTRTEALEILNLKEGASPPQIKTAYKKLMGKIHPDREGSAWMASKLNEARDILLGKK